MTADETVKIEADEAKDSETSKVMSLMDHLGELRSRLFKSAVVVVVFFAICMGFASQLIEFAKGPLAGALPEAANTLHFTGPMDVFIAQIKISLLVSVIAACPVWLYQFWRFLEPALYEHEKKYAMPFMLASVILFFTGVSFCFFVILPMAMKFLITLGMDSATPIITIGDYLSMVMLLILGFGAVFETPVLIILLALLDLVTADFLSEYRKLVVVGILVLAAVLTPPDPISQIAMAVPIYIMYEMSILIIRYIKRKPKEAS